MAAMPRIVILDIQMPGGTGHEILKKLKRIPKTSQVPVVVVTGLDYPSLPEELKERGADAVFTKPPNIEMLDKEVSRLLEIAGPQQARGE